MVSTFHGLEVAKRGLFTQQSALYTTGHNISNANTPGYTRQRVNFEQTGPFPAASRNRPEIPGQMGSGVQAGSIERVRVGFLDDQFRGENSKTGYYEARSDAFGRLESLMNEPSDSGLAKTMDRFWQSLQDLSVNPQNSGARDVVVQRGQAVAETFNYLSNTLHRMQNDIKTEVGVTTKEVNSLSNQINHLNKQIAEVEPHGYVPNDLYDERDRLIDQLSGIVTIDVSYEDTPRSADPLAMGKATISLVGSNGQALAPTLVDGATNSVNEVKVDYPNDGTPVAESISIGDRSYDVEDFSQGKLKGLVESGGYMSGGKAKGTYEQMVYDLDKMATAYATAMNTVQKGGESLNSMEDGTEPPNFFFVDDTLDTDEAGVVRGLAGSLDVTDAVKADADHIAAANSELAGNGGNALDLANVLDEPAAMLGEETSVGTFYESMIGTMAVEAQEAYRMQSNSATLKASVNQQRQSVSAVSLDEEMTNMIKFQHAYNAAARNITVVDEMLDRIINQMGR
ncbi:flagellar hook-associated protein FlgK [Halobacillus shinanisalinarum]|uniref:Flagellar hook-associated protein 1 n=1 Tax=Halobacillus shinanisalinarum TaxID=2932258 RepID=A0ABY4H3B7_9BACI|nr:flagellar hook-associated protein FlgK [Halobacillus shinanisalinarum]UOQ94400.1 flagellar hook-associated protein FlgK [Halobacillus shinanisalinarum]